MSSITPTDQSSKPAEKGYVPASHEPRIRAAWDAANAWRADPSRVDPGASPTHAPGAKRPPFCVLIPPPNVTGALHLGHALNNTLQDILTRTHRMLGYECLWMPGTDHAGIATQAVVERRLLKEQNKRRTDYSREEFVGLVQQWKDEYEARISEQLRAMGCSCDWSRQRFTMDEICARAVREAFYRLFEQGLIYRGKRLVNWDPALQTAVADDECYDEEHNAFFYYLRYPLTAPATMADGSVLTHVTVATTRPETYLGDTAVAMSPHDPRAAALAGKRVRLPLVGREIPIIVDPFVVLPKAMARTDEERNDPKAEFATGFLKVTPAHDPNDYEIGVRHKLPIINVMSPDGRVSDQFGWSDVNEAREFVGMKFAAAREAVLKKFESIGLLESKRPYSHSLKHSDRSKAVIEPYLSDQWFCKVTDPRMAESANEAVRSGQMAFTPARYAKMYESWHDNIRDWCVSRQLWWGHRIPVWSRAISAAEAPGLAQLAARLDAWAAEGVLCVRDFASQKAVTAAASLSAVPAQGLRLFVCLRADHAEAIGALNAAGFSQDEDVLDTWFSSALWPLSTLGWPDPDAFADTKGLLSAFNPTSVLSTAREIITLWVSRMVMMTRLLLATPAGPGPAPFRDVFIHAVVQDGNGHRMSKSAGNGVDPLDIIASHGSDAMRFTLCQMTTQTQDVKMPVVKDPHSERNTSPRFDLGRNFANKLFNACQGLVIPKLRGAQLPEGEVDSATLSTLDRWMLTRVSRGVDRATRAIRGYEFSEYAEAIYDLLWRDFCDVYLEAIKPTIESDAGQRAALRCGIDAILRIMHPVMPYVTEATWEHIRPLPMSRIRGVSLPQTTLLALAPWPVFSPSILDEHAERTIDRTRAIAAAINQVRALQNVAPKRKIILHAGAAPADLAAMIRGAEGVLATLAGLAEISSAPAGKDAPSVVVEGLELKLSSLADALDPAAERDRLTRRIAEEERKVATITGRMNNPGYMAKAPPKLVEESKAQLAQSQAELETLRAALGRLS